MNGLLEKTGEFLSAYKDKKLAVGLSGGRDSVCLLHAVLHCGAIDRSNVVAVHVNHYLRDTADRDERFARDLCKSLGVVLLSYGVDVKKACALSGQTVEQAAREKRYGIFGDVIKSGKADYILTAHHALDNAETVLMHMFRGSGLDGMCGIAATNAEKRLLRPFVNVYPDEIDAYVEENGLHYVVDETNFVTDADRNFIRLEVIPLIEKRYRGVVRAVNALASDCAEACGALDGFIDRTHIRHSHGATIIDISVLEGVFAGRYVRTALADFSLTDITRDQTERVVGLAHMRTGASVELSNGLSATRETDGVAIYLPRRICRAEKPVKVGAVFIDGLAVDIEPTDKAPESVKGGIVDADKLCGAVVRFRRDGDVFVPFGGGRKKLKQFLIDNKVPKRLRDRIPLICRGNEVLVVVGMQVSDAVAVQTDTVHRVAVTSRW